MDEVAAFLRCSRRSTPCPSRSSHGWRRRRASPHSPAARRSSARAPGRRRASGSCARAGSNSSTTAGCSTCSGPGEPSGLPSMLAELPTGFAARAHGPTTCYCLPGDVSRPRPPARPARGPAPRRADDPRARPAAAGVARAEAAPALERPVGGLLRASALYAASRTRRSASAAERMTATGQTCAVVDLADGRFGVLTDRDLRTRVVAAGLPVDTAVARAMSAPAYTVTEDRLAGDVLVEMLDRGVRHFPVLSKTGALLGVVDDASHDATSSPPSAARRSTCARRSGARRTPPSSRSSRATCGRRSQRCTTRAWRPSTSAPIVAVVTDVLVRRLLDLAVADAGEPPSPFAWLALGSVARREAVPSSDIDSRDRVGRRRRRRGDARVRRACRAVGPRRARGVRAARRSEGRLLGGSSPVRALARRLGAAIDGWFDDPTQEKALILVSIVGDSRPVWGVHRAAPLAEHVAAARSHRGLLRLMARYALLYRPPTGFLRDLVVEHSGEQEGRLDLKHGGMLPIVDLARGGPGWRPGATSNSTRERLRAAPTGGVLSEDDGGVLEEARARVRAAARAPGRAGREGDAARRLHPPLGRLTPLTRSYLKDAFRAVAAVQRRIGGGAALRHRLMGRRRGRRGRHRRREGVLLQVDPGSRDRDLRAAPADQRDPDRQAAARADAGRQRGDREAGHVPRERQQNAGAGSSSSGAEWPTPRARGRRRDRRPQVEQRREASMPWSSMKCSPLNDQLGAAWPVRHQRAAGRHRRRRSLLARFNVQQRRGPGLRTAYGTTRVHRSGGQCHHSQTSAPSGRAHPHSTPRLVPRGSLAGAFCLLFFTSCDTSASSRRPNPLSNSAKYVSSSMPSTPGPAMVPAT